MNSGDVKTVQNVPESHMTFLLEGFKMVPKFETYGDFFPYYLAEHSLPICRTLHYIGTALATAVTIYALYSQQFWILLLSPLAGYSFAWFATLCLKKTNQPLLIIRGGLL